MNDDDRMRLTMTKLTCQRIAREEQRITAWMSDGSAGRATPDKRNKACFITYKSDADHAVCSVSRRQVWEG